MSRPNETIPLALPGAASAACTAGSRIAAMTSPTSIAALSPQAGMAGAHAMFGGSVARGVRS